MNILLQLEASGLFLPVVTCLGLIVGSFLNVVIHRLPLIMERQWQSECQQFLELDAGASTETPLSLAFPGSSCPKCHNSIRPWHNIPVLSYLFLRGRCAYCSEGISIRYPMIELFSGLLSLTAAIAMGPTVALLGTLCLIWTLIALAGIDFDTHLLPDSLTLPLLWLGLLLNLLNTFTSIDSAVMGAVLGYLALWSVYWLFKLVSGKEGMGYGDFKLLAALGAWFGWQALPIIIILSSLVGAVLGAVMLLLAKGDRSTPIPFGPFLAGAGLIYLFFGSDINAWYFQTLGI